MQQRISSWCCGMENFLVALYNDRERVKRLIRGIADYQVALTRYYIELGVDGGWCSEDIGTQRQLLIRPALWRELFKPEMGGGARDARRPQAGATSG